MCQWALRSVVGRQYSYFLHWCHILLFRYGRNVAREEKNWNQTHMHLPCSISKYCNALPLACVINKFVVHVIMQDLSSITIRLPSRLFLCAGASLWNDFACKLPPHRCCRGRCGVNFNDNSKLPDFENPLFGATDSALSLVLAKF